MPDKPTPGMRRRTFFTAGAAATGLAALAVKAPAVSAATVEGWQGPVSANGWPIPGRDPGAAASQLFRVEGADIGLFLAPGPAAVLLLHVLRRYHYEVAELQPGSVSGGTVNSGGRDAASSNYLSGTAVTIAPNLFPRGSSGNYFAYQVNLIRDILLDCSGLVRWGGDDRVVREGHFEITTPPGTAALATVSAKLDQRSSALDPAGLLSDLTSSDRRRRALSLAREQAPS